MFEPFFLAFDHLPLLLLLFALGAGYTLYFIASLSSHFSEDEEMSRRQKSPILSRWMSQGFAFTLKPLLSLLLKRKVTPLALTLTGLFFGSFSGFLVALGEWEWGGFFYVLAGFCDYLDGKVARSTGRVSPQGAILDSLLDRVSDAAVLSGVLFYYRREPLPTLLTLLALWISFLIPYLRAKGEAVGIPMAIGILHRQERVVILAVALLLSPLISQLFGDPTGFPYPLMGFALLLFLLLGGFTLIQRTRKILRHGSVSQG